MFLSPYLILPQIYQGREEWIETAPKSASILELWEIDTFEGGSASRSRFLEKTAYAFQNKTISNYIIVRALELQQAQNLIANGTRPDLISFGVGAGELLAGIAQELNLTENIRSDLLAGGVYEGKIKAVPWCFGGYCLCAKEKIDFSINTLNSLQEQKDISVLGAGYEYNIPYKALNNDETKLLNKEQRTQYQAYESFLRGTEFQILLGSQRDFYRLNNKVNLGILEDVSFKYLDTYTDLIQYIAITTSNENLFSPAEQFVQFLTSPINQKKLTSIGMFSVGNTSIYDNNYQDFEKALSNKLQVLNVFTPNVTIKNIQSEIFNEK